MTFMILLLLVAVGVYFYKRSEFSDPTEVKNRCKGRSSDQRNVIRYFCVDGCFKVIMSDQAYDALVQSYSTKQNFRQKAIDKIGLDESEIKEIDPIHFEGYVYDKNTFWKYGKDNKPRSSKYQISWLFFSSTQVYLFQYTFNLDEDGKKESTEEFFWKDITNFSASSDTEEASYWDNKENKFLLKNVSTNRFALTVPGEKFYCYMEQNNDTERAIQAMKSKLREKKNI